MIGFVVFSLPRSRSAWLSVLLGQDGVVGHDIGLDCGSVAEFVNAPYLGTCETGAGFAWRVMRRMVPGVKFAVILRDAHEVTKSLERFGFAGPDLIAEMQSREDDLMTIADQKGVMLLHHSQLDDFDICARLYEHLTSGQLSRARFDMLKPLNIQVDMRAVIEKTIRNASHIAALKAEARGLMCAN